MRTVCSGISGGTERLVFCGDVPEDVALDDTIKSLAGAFRYPFPYGYACVGRVAEDDRLVFAFHPHQDVFTAAPDDLISLPAVDAAAGTLFPMVETALQITLDSGAGYLDRVVVPGAGVVGLTIRSTQVSTVPVAMSGTWTVPRRRAEAAALLPELPLAELCTHVFPFAQAAEAFRAVDENMPGLMHAVLDYDGGANDDARVD